jgi:hypothetical protein
MKALHGENVDEMELFIQINKKTEGTFVIMSAIPLKDKTGKLQELAVFHDITERKSENLIKDLNEDLKKVTERTTNWQKS